MNTNKLKAYAPKARLAFMQAVTKRAALLGLYEDRISDVNIQGDNAIIEGRLFTLKQGQQRNQLAKRIKSLGTVDGELNLQAGFKQFINETAFTWFNRLTAIRYMEINGYLDHGFRVLSKSENATFEQGFEILAHAADVAEDLDLDKSQIVQLMLDGDKEEELYREILLGQCHQLSTVMPFMFEKLDDETELLLPDNLTKTDSILKALINDLPEDNWIDRETGAGQIEVIGWLYQFYISEHKDAVIGKVVKREDIPAATQLFTPNWIVKYLVQNSVGRQWLATYPDSELKDKMEYYITPAEQSDEVIEQLKAITPTSIDPETIKVLDPAAGSGHILVEVYEVLREIYLERGYRLREIPELILTKNIYGLDIDDRAAQMAAFAVLMKAREDDKRIFSRIADNDLKLNIFSMQSTENLDINKLWDDLDFAEKQHFGDMVDMFAEPESGDGDDSFAELSAENQSYLNLLRYLQTQFIDAKNLGSLIEIDSQYQELLVALKAKLNDKATSNHRPTRLAVEALLPIVEQSILLANKYDAVVANPPYMGSKGMNVTLKEFAKKSYPNSKSDLFSMMKERAFNLLYEHGFNAMIVMESWMFLSSYENIREKILKNNTIIDFIHMPYDGKGRTPLGINFGTSASIIQKSYIDSFEGNYSCIRYFEIDDSGVPLEFPVQNERQNNIKSMDFNKIPGWPIAYWLDEKTLEIFSLPQLKEAKEVGSGLSTSDNERFLRYIWEVPFNEVCIDVKSCDESALMREKWFLFQKGGEYRKWYGNLEYVVNWKSNGKEIKNWVTNNPNDPKTTHWSRRVFNTELYFREGFSWSTISSGKISFRYLQTGSMISNAAGGVFGFESSDDLYDLLGLLNSKIWGELFQVINPTLNYSAGVIQKAPILSNLKLPNVEKLINLSKKDWDSFEKSIDFTGNPLINSIQNSNETLKSTYKNLVVLEKDTLKDFLFFEQEIEEIIANKLSSKIRTETENIKNLSLFTNPYYVFGNRCSEGNIEVLRLSAHVNNLLSYSIGNMMGRFSLDREGLIYANSGNNGFKELEAQGAYKTFPADDDGIIPLASEEWLFEDDATARFKEFVKTVWGAENLTENLDFVAESLCLDAIKPKRGEGAMDTIRRYFATKFYKDHLKTYKKRPIYWLFSSGKEKAFECLVYLHRYNESTLARMRTEYVTPLMGKMETQLALLSEKITNESSTAEKARFNKELKSLQNKQIELRTFDEELKHYSELKISLDLDDGVKVNYGKFGNLLADVKAIHGKKPKTVK